MQMVHRFLTDRILGARDRRGCPSSCAFSGSGSSVLGDVSHRRRGALSGQGEGSWSRGLRRGARGWVRPALRGARSTALRPAWRFAPAPRGIAPRRLASGGLRLLPRPDTLCFEGDAAPAAGLGASLALPSPRQGAPSAASQSRRRGRGCRLPARCGEGSLGLPGGRPSTRTHTPSLTHRLRSQPRRCGERQAGRRAALPAHRAKPAGLGSARRGGLALAACRRHFCCGQMREASWWRNPSDKEGVCCKKGSHAPGF